MHFCSTWTPLLKERFFESIWGPIIVRIMNLLCLFLKPLNKEMWVVSCSLLMVKLRVFLSKMMEHRLCFKNYMSYMSLCAYVPLFICPYVPLSLCSYVPMSLCTYVPKSLCPYVLMFLCLCIPMSLYSCVLISLYRHGSVSLSLMC